MDDPTWFEDRTRTGNTILEGITFLRRIDYVRWDAEDSKGETTTLSVFGRPPIPILFKYIYDGFSKEVLCETPLPWSDVLSRRIFPTSPPYPKPPHGIILGPPTCNHYTYWLRAREVKVKLKKPDLLIPGKPLSAYEKHLGDIEYLVRHVRGVDPIALSRHESCGSEYVKEAFVIAEIVSAMKDTRSVWITQEHLVAIRSSDTLNEAAKNLVAAGVLVSYEDVDDKGVSQVSVALKWAADQVEAFMDRIGYEFADLKFIHDPKVRPVALTDIANDAGPEFRYDAGAAIDLFIDEERVPITATSKFDGEDGLVWRRPYLKPVSRLRDELPPKYPPGVVRVIYTTRETDMNSVYADIGHSLVGRTLVVSDGPCGAHFGRPGSYTCIVTAKNALSGIKRHDIILVEENVFVPDKYTIRADGGKTVRTVPKILVHEATRKVQTTRPQILPYTKAGTFEHVIILSSMVFHERWVNEALRIVGERQGKNSVILVLR